MDLTPTVDQEEIISSTRAFLADRLPVARTRELIEEPSNVDIDAWRGSAEQGWFGLGLAEALGGVGVGLADESLLFREIGRSLASGPFLATTLAVRVAAAAGLDDLAASLLDGTARAGLAEPRSQLGSFGPGSIDGDLDLFDPVGAEVVVLAGVEGAALLSMASLSGARAVECIDPATRLHEARADSAAPLAFVGADVDPVFLRGVTLSAASLAGMAEALRDLSAAHARTRLQFGSPIGTNQAIKHPCADMHIRAEAAWSQTVFAALALDEGRADAEFHALAAKVVASQAARRNAAASIQVHGGMGYTFEHDAHLYMKRAHVLGHVLGDARWAQARLLDLPVEL